VSRSDAAALLKLAESIADGGTIDWSIVEASASHEDQAVIRQLRVLDNLAGLHRSQPMPDEPSATQSGPVLRRGHAAPAIGNWAHLTLLERLGGGTFGEVYRAWDRHLEREVALKLLRVDEASDDLQNSRIAREGRLLARVRHPNVITVYGVDAHDGRVGLWMDLVRGVTLEQQLGARGPFSASEAAAIGIDLCRALAAIHAAGLIHRDVKAQNVMREEGGRIVLMDLGTSREADRVVARGVPELAGTPLYFAPEIFGGAPASKRTDLYSLCVLLYRLVTGSFPVQATSIEQLQEAHAAGSIVRLRDARADLPTGFVRVVDRATTSDPANRYQSTAEFEADLASTLHQPASPAANIETLPPKPRRNIVWGGSVAAAAVAAVIIVGALALPWPPPFLRSARIESIAVLPLANLSSDASQEYFADGMTDLLIGDLARIHALRVISRTSAMQFKGTTKSIQEIAKALNVDAVLEGTVQRFGDRVRISADLVQASTDKHVWAETYERDVKDILSLQSDVARAIAKQVQVQLTPVEQAGFAVAAATQRQVNAAAQEAYLQGRFFWNKRTFEAHQIALDYFQKAERLDPTFALAYAGEADTLNLRPNGIAPSTAYPAAKAAAHRALQLEPTLAEAHASLAFASFVFDRDWAEAEAGFKRAIQYNGGYATAHQWYGIFLSAMGRVEESSAEFTRAKALDPLSPSIRTSFGEMLLMAKRYDEAIAELQGAHDLDPAAPAPFLFLSRAYYQKGMSAEAVAIAERGQLVAPQPILVAQLARLAAADGRRADAMKRLDALAGAALSPNEIGAVYAALGDKDRAFSFLQRAADERTGAILWARVDPALDTLRDDPRFTTLLRSLRLVN